MVKVDWLWSKQSVLAALQHRAPASLMRLHIYEGVDTVSDDRLAAIRRAARDRRVPIVPARSRNALAALLRASSRASDRVPQGVLLECETRQPLVLDAPGDVDAILARLARSRRPPVAIFLEQVTDANNLAHVARACAFFGLSDVLLSARGSAPLSDVVSVASAGASEAIVFHSVHPRDLATLPQIRLFAAVVPSAAPEARAVQQLGDVGASTPTGALSVLAFGSEGAGLGARTVERAVPFFIPGGEPASPLLDSLNVGVSVAVTLSHVLHPAASRT
jgi:tRNA G18 (ribose-2'-O)-methylase SpoU